MSRNNSTNIRHHNSTQEQFALTRAGKVSSLDNYFSEPHEVVEIERAVLGAILIDKGSMSLVARILKPLHFYDYINAQVYEALMAMWDEQEPIDLLTVVQKLKSLGKNVDVPYIVGLTQEIGSALHIERHAMLIIQAYVARSYVEVGMKITAIASDKKNDLADVIKSANKLIENANAGASLRKSEKHIGQIALDAIKEVENRARKRAEGITPGITTGLSELDSITTGLRGGQLWIIAGRPAMGKTAMTIKLAVSAAMSGIPVCMYQLEMTGISMVDRVLISMSGIDPSAYRSGNMNAEDWKNLEIARVNLTKLPIYIDDNPSADMTYIRSHSMMMQHQGKCGMIIVDYLQLAVSGDSRFREQEVAQASRTAKLTAKELDVPFILLAQLNREAERRSNKRPELSDLRESGSIEQDADVVALLYRPEYYGFEEIDNMSARGLGVLIIAKQRDGATGDVYFGYNKSLTRIFDYNNSQHSNECPY